MVFKAKAPRALALGDAKLYVRDKAGMTRTLQPLERVSTTTPVVPADQPWEDLLAYVAVHRVATPAGGEELRTASLFLL